MLLWWFPDSLELKISGPLYVQHHCPASKETLRKIRRWTMLHCFLHQAPKLGVEVTLYTQPATKSFQSRITYVYLIYDIFDRFTWDKDQNDHKIICFIADVLRFPTLPSPLLWLKIHPSGSHVGPGQELTGTQFQCVAHRLSWLVAAICILFVSICLCVAFTPLWYNSFFF